MGGHSGGADYIRFIDSYTNRATTFHSPRLNNFERNYGVGDLSGRECNAKGSGEARYAQEESLNIVARRRWWVLYLIDIGYSSLTDLRV